MTPSDRPETVTLWVVPEGGAAPSRQIVLSIRWLHRMALLGAVAAAAVLLSLFIGFGALPRAVAYGPLEAENLELRARLLELESKLDTVDRELRRLRLYEEQLNAIDQQDLPGFGPVESPLSEGIIEPEWFSEGYPGTDTGQPALEGAATAEVDLPVVSRLEAANDRADAILRQIRLAEIELGQVVETAESFRARAGAIPSAWPLDGVLTSGFGWRRSPFTRRWKFHFGIDVSAPVGTIIRAPAAGVVVTAEYHSGYGRLLEIDHGYEVVTRYAHNARLLVGVGESVRLGQPISTVGMTGATTGPHLHYEIYVEGQPVDPLEHLD